jgi:hypothetical protein
MLQRDADSYEFRTTLSPSLTDESTLHDIGHMVHKDSRWYLQRCRDEQPKTAYDHLEEEQYIQRALTIAKLYSNHVYLRG